MASFKWMVQSLLKITTYLNSPGSKTSPLPSTSTTKRLQTNTILFLAVIFLQPLALMFITLPPNLYGEILLWTWYPEVIGPKRKFLNLPKHGIPSASWLVEINPKSNQKKKKIQRKHQLRHKERNETIIVFGSKYHTNYNHSSSQQWSSSNLRCENHKNNHHHQALSHSRIKQCVTKLASLHHLLS